MRQEPEPGMGAALAPSPPDLAALFAGLDIKEIPHLDLLNGQASVCFACMLFVCGHG